MTKLKKRSPTITATIEIPVDQDPGLTLTLGEGQYRCSGCNLPTSEEDGWVCAAPLLGYLQGVDIDVAVCEGCFNVARDNAGEGEPKHTGPERPGDQWLYPPHLRPHTDTHFFSPSIRYSGVMPADESDRAGS